MQYALDQEHLDNIEKILREDLIEIGVHSLVFADLAGNIVVELNNGEATHDVYSLTALAAGNFGAVNAMANAIGQDEFSLLFHKGDNVSIYFSKVLDDFLLITIFGKETSLGLLRLKVSESSEKIEKVLAFLYSKKVNL